ncbi:hypothetical protein NMG60_11022459 [Bertholletia excelsa]
MAATAPLEIGTRGTMGSLVMKEIEYFRRLELEGIRGRSNRKPWRSFGVLVMGWKRKKRQGSGVPLPSMCSTVDVSQIPRSTEMPGFSYRNLKEEAKKGKL